MISMDNGQGDINIPTKIEQIVLKNNRNADSLVHNNDMY